MRWRALGGLSVVASAAVACVDAPAPVGEAVAEVAAGSGGDDRCGGPGSGIEFDLLGSFAAGKSPSDAAAADFDSDGVLDLVVSNREADVMGLLLGDGNGGFGAPRFFATGDAPTAVAAADLNGDGAVDAVVAHGADKRGSVFLGRGDGTFEVPLRPVSGAGRSIAVADFDRDGHLDLVVSGSQTHLVLGRGDGAFGPPIAVTGGGFRVLAQDWNGDDVPDLTVLSEPGTFLGQVSVMLGRGDGSFEPAGMLEIGDRPGDIGAGDFDRDGALDLAISLRSEESMVLIFLGQGDGTFTAGPVLDVGVEARPAAIRVAELDGDGLLDLAVASNRHGDVSIWLGDGDGGFRAGERFAAGSRPEVLLAADFDRDGAIDLAGPVLETDSLTVLLGKGNGQFRAPRHLVAGRFPIVVSIADLNDDGIPDLVATDDGSDYAAFHFGRGDGSFEPVVFQPTYGAFAILASDMNGDGRTDISFDTGRGPAVLLGNGDGTFQPPLQAFPDRRTARLALGDLDRDGALDAVTLDLDTSAVLSFLGRGDGTLEAPRDFPFDEPPSAPPGLFLSDLSLGDVNGDGALDAAVSVPERDEVALLLGRGDGAFGPPRTIRVGGDQPVSMVLADLDGDGPLDLVTANRGSADLSVLFGRGDGRFRQAQIYDVAGGATALSAADFDGDGRLDLVTNGGNLTVIILENRGHRRFRAVSLPFAGVAAGDLNLDGRADLAGTDALYFVDVLMSSAAPR